MRLALNSLLIYFDCEPGDKEGFVVWLEPTRNLCQPDRLLVGSRDAQIEEGPGEAEELARVGELIREPLLGRRLEGMQLETPKYDLALVFEGGYRLRTFAAEANDDHSWHIRQLESDGALYGSPLGLRWAELHANNRSGKSEPASEQP